LIVNATGMVSRTDFLKPHAIFSRRNSQNTIEEIFTAGTAETRRNNMEK